MELEASVAEVSRAFGYRAQFFERALLFSDSGIDHRQMSPRVYAIHRIFRLRHQLDAAPAFLNRLDLSAQPGINHSKDAKRLAARCSGNGTAVGG
jgi:hypothetical protein